MQSGDCDILLIYPQLGSFDELIRDIPLSLIYAATDSVKSGFNVKILDLRVLPYDWIAQLEQILKKKPFLVGLSVMTGHPITTSLEISKYIKAKYDIPIVWGGPHPTILPEQTLECEYIDYIIRDWGSKALCQLAKYIVGHSDTRGNILGLGYKIEGKTVLNPVQCQFEMLNHEDLPYHLVDMTGDRYNRLGNQTIMPIYTSMGCPYQCTFCMSPAVYQKIQGKKWLAYPQDVVLDHVKFLLNKYDFQRLQIYDDDSFVDIDRMDRLLNEYVKQGFHKRLKLDFRGARVNELDRMDDRFLRLLVQANVELLAIGVESGSSRTLEKMKKGITVEQIIRVNQKLARFPSLQPHYNFFCGIPGETYEDLVETKELILRLLKEHPKAYLGVGADWKPLPGSIMTERAVRDYGLHLPKDLEGWAEIDSFDAPKKIFHPWYTRKINGMIKLLQITGQLLDRKVQDYYRVMGIAGYFVLLLRNGYQPFLRLRLRFNFISCLVEYDAAKIFFSVFTKYQRLRQRRKKEKP